MKHGFVWSRIHFIHCPRVHLTREMTAVCGRPLHTLNPVAQKMGQRYTLSHKNVTSQKQGRNRVFASDTLSHNFPFCMIPCRIIFTAKGHPVERHIPSSQVWEYHSPFPRLRVCMGIENSTNHSGP